MKNNFKKQVEKKIYTNGNPSVCINVKDITYIEKIKSKKIVIIHLNNNEEYIDTKTLKELEKDLFDYGFIRIDYGVMVNLKHISKIGNDEKGKKFVQLGEKCLHVTKRRINFLNNFITNEHLTAHLQA